MALNRSADVQKFAYAIVGFILFVGGGAFAWHLWSGTNLKTDEVEISSIRGDIKLKPTMSIAIEERAGQGLIAIVTLTNDTSTRMIMPETVISEPLYNLTLKYGPTGAPPVDAAQPFGGSSTDAITVADALPAIAFDPKHDAVIELLPAHSHTLTIPLQSKFRFSPGNYELSVKFQPLNVESTDGSTLPNFNVGVSVEKVKFAMPLGSDKGSDKSPEAPEPAPAVKMQKPPLTNTPPPLKTAVPK